MTILQGKKKTTCGQCPPICSMQAPFHHHHCGMHPSVPCPAEPWSGVHSSPVWPQARLATGKIPTSCNLIAASPKDLASAEYKSVGQHTAWAPDLLVTGPLMVFLKQIILFPPSKCLALNSELLQYFQSTSHSVTVILLKVQGCTYHLL